MKLAGIERPAPASPRGSKPIYNTYEDAASPPKTLRGKPTFSETEYEPVSALVSLPQRQKRWIVFPKS